jgi:hypothetical protein
MPRGVLLGAVLLLSLGASSSAHAQVFTFDNGSGLAAKATFSVDNVNSRLSILLENVGDPAENNGEVLTGLVWNDGGGVIYSPFSISSSPLINNDGTAFGGDATRLGRNWQELEGAAGFNGSVSTIGASIWGPDGDFPPAPPGEMVNGVNWGIVNGVTSFGGNQEPFANNTITFVLSYSGGPPVISAASFNYGSNLNLQPGTPTPGSIVPEPTSALLLLGGAPALGFLRRRQRRKTAA